MNKTKILIPVLSIAGLGATIAPIAAMTSCSCTKPESDVPTVEQTLSDMEYDSTGSYCYKLDVNLKTNVLYTIKAPVSAEAIAQSAYYSKFTVVTETQVTNDVETNLTFKVTQVPAGWSMNSESKKCVPSTDDKRITTAGDYTFKFYLTDSLAKSEIKCTIWLTNSK